MNQILWVQIFMQVKEYIVGYYLKQVKEVLKEIYLLNHLLVEYIKLMKVHF